MSQHVQWYTRVMNIFFDSHQLYAEQAMVCMLSDDTWFI